MSRPRKYPRELLQRGTRLVLESGRPITHVARDLGVPAESLRRYVVLQGFTWVGGRGFGRI